MSGLSTVSGQERVFIRKRVENTTLIRLGEHQTTKPLSETRTNHRGAP